MQRNNEEAEAPSHAEFHREATVRINSRVVCRLRIWVPSEVGLDKRQADKLKQVLSEKAHSFIFHMTENDEAH